MTIKKLECVFIFLPSIFGLAMLAAILLVHCTFYLLQSYSKSVHVNGIFDARWMILLKFDEENWENLNIEIISVHVKKIQSTVSINHTTVVDFGSRKKGLSNFQLHYIFVENNNCMNYIAKDSWLLSEALKHVRLFGDGSFCSWKMCNVPRNMVWLHRYTDHEKSLLSWSHLR